MHIYTEKAESADNELFEFGSVFYMKDENTLVVDYKGAFFELKKK